MIKKLTKPIWLQYPLKIMTKIIENKIVNGRDVDKVKIYETQI